MLFNSYIFLFAFLPIVICVYFMLLKWLGQRSALAWIILASFTFYGWHIPQFVLLLAGSVIFNFFVGGLLISSHAKTQTKRLYLAIALTTNIGLLGYFKYTNFFLSVFADIFGEPGVALKIALPLGISFFTFQQIAYLVDCHAGKAAGRNFIEYTFFVTFFPQLVAGPIVHHNEIIRQLVGEKKLSASAENIVVGIAIFSIGLFKKVILADTMGSLATPGFEAVAAGQTLSFYEAWIAAFAFGLEIYFDFSAYSDMAIGIGRMIGINLPVNFNSPYKATNIIDFWRRWHITLSRFLRDYLYLPLGGNRLGRFRRYNNLMIVMLLGGMWHGAGWLFLIWGGLHGSFLVINHGWRALIAKSPWIPASLAIVPPLARRLFAWATTFLAVTVAWVFFRADNLETATSITRSMAGLNGFALPQDTMIQFGHVWHLIFMAGFPDHTLVKLGFGSLGAIGIFTIVFFLPNTQQFMGRYNRALEYDAQLPRNAAETIRISWRPSLTSAVCSAMLLILSIVALRADTSEFIYFQF